MYSILETRWTFVSEVLVGWQKNFADSHRQSTVRSPSPESWGLRHHVHRGAVGFRGGLEPEWRPCSLVLFAAGLLHVPWTKSCSPMGERYLPNGRWGWRSASEWWWWWWWRWRWWWLINEWTEWGTPFFKRNPFQISITLPFLPETSVMERHCWRSSSIIPGRAIAFKPFAAFHFCILLPCFPMSDQVP